jgi:hypothetical protein
MMVGNDKKANFWHVRWLNGQALVKIAPELLRFAWRKNLMVKQALSNRNWFRGLQRISSTSQVQQFVRLWTLVQQVQLSEQHDEIRWRFTEGGKYSSKSAYSIQFAGSFAYHCWVQVWKAKVEEKCMFSVDCGHDSQEWGPNKPNLLLVSNKKGNNPSSAGTVLLLQGRLGGAGVVVWDTSAAATVAALQAFQELVG